MPRIKSNDRMPSRSDANIQDFLDDLYDWRSAHRDTALDFAEDVGPDQAFELLHAIRRWYSGQTMARLIHAYRPILREVMAIEPEDAVGLYRGFKVDVDNVLADADEGEVFTIPVARNHGFSSWSTSPSVVDRFSGSGRGKVGIVVRLEGPEWITPVLAPPEATAPWFNALYARVIGSSFRPTEGEYLIYGTKFSGEIVRVKG